MFRPGSRMLVESFFPAYIGDENEAVGGTDRAVGSGVADQGADRPSPSDRL